MFTQSEVYRIIPLVDAERTRSNRQGSELGLIGIEVGVVRCRIELVGLRVGAERSRIGVVGFVVLWGFITHSFYTHAYGRQSMSRHLKMVWLRLVLRMMFFTMEMLW